MDMCSHAYAHSQSTYVNLSQVSVHVLMSLLPPVIPADYSGQLTLLLRYPSTVDPDPIALGDSHPASLLLRQALALQLSPTPMAGTAVMTDNRIVLNIPLEVPEPPPPRSRQGRSRGGTPQPGTPGTPGGRGAHSKQLSSQMSLPDIARGLRASSVKRIQSKSTKNLTHNPIEAFSQP